MAVSLPPDRSHLLTETRNPRSADLHRRSVAACIALIQDEDRAVHDAVVAARPALIAFAEAAAPRFAGGGRLVYLGAGTSGRLGVLDASEAPPTFQVEPGRVVGLIAGGDVALRRSSEGAEDDPDGAGPALRDLALTCADSVLGIAAGGTTPYVRGALAIAKRLAPGCLTGLLCCAAVPAPPGCDHLIVAPTGPEVLTGSTRMKAGTATKLLLNALSTTLMVQVGKVHGNLMVDVRASNAKLRDRAARIVAALCGCDRDAAFALLDAAGGAVKTAVVMAKTGLDRTQAEVRLAAHDGRLDRALISP